MATTTPSFDDPDLAARLAAWSETDDSIGAFATVASQRARIAELESEVDRVVERWQRWELEAIALRAQLADREAEAAATAAAAAASQSARPVLPRLPGRGR